MSEIHHLTQPSAGDGVDIVQECLAEIETAGLTRNAAAREIGVSATTLSLWLRGEYGADPAAVTAKVELWLATRREAARRSLNAAGLDRHRDLSVTDEILTALAHAQAVGDVVLIHGASGAGKSWAARHYCRTHSAAYVVTATCAVRSLSGLLGRVGGAIGVGARHGSALEAEDAVIGRLADRGAILVVDEAHHLTPRLLDELRCIRDVSGCGLALIGDDSVRMALARCPQILGRVGVRVGVRAHSEADVRLLMHGILGRAPRKGELKTAIHAARGPGGLHALRRLMARAWLLAQADGRDAIDRSADGDDVEMAADEEAAA